MKHKALLPTDSLRIVKLAATLGERDLREKTEAQPNRASLAAGKASIERIGRDGGGDAQHNRQVPAAAVVNLHRLGSVALGGQAQHEPTVQLFSQRFDIHGLFVQRLRFGKATSPFQLLAGAVQYAEQTFP